MLHLKSIIRNERNDLRILQEVNIHWVFSQVLLYGSDTFGLKPVNTQMMTSGLPDKLKNSALAAAISEILIRCQEDQLDSDGFHVTMTGMKKHFTSAGKMRADGITETLLVYKLHSKTELFQFISEHLGFITGILWTKITNIFILWFYVGAGNNSVICFLYSCILTRGMKNVKSDMDNSDTALIAAHGYCSQEMVNLIITGD